MYSYDDSLGDVEVGTLRTIEQNTVRLTHSVTLRFNDRG